MKRESKMNRVSSSKPVVKNRKLAVAAVMGLVACVAAALFVAQAYNARKTEAAASTSSPQIAVARRARLHSRLALQPQADRMRRRLGLRFISQGREVSSMTGTVTFNATTHPVAIIRRQDDDGEQVSISLGGGQPLTWNGREGARSAGGAASADERKLIERISLDSPDQFILAQLRAASYYTVAERVMPQQAASSDDYSGPIWDVVRVGEASNSSGARPESAYRLYYINSSTGLIERIISNEQGQTVVAELSGWAQVNGERVPTRVVWTIDKRVVMEFNLGNVTLGPRPCQTWRPLCHR